MEAWATQDFQGLEASGHGNRVARKRSRLVDRAYRRQMFHDVPASAKGAHRHTAADDLAKRCQVWRYPVQPLCAGARHSETSHDFVEDQDCTEAIAELTQGFEEAGDGRDAVHVPGDGFDDDAGDVIPMGLEPGANAINVVVIKGCRQFGQRRRYPRRAGLAQRQGA